MVFFKNKKIKLNRDELFQLMNYLGLNPTEKFNQIEKDPLRGHRNASIVGGTYEITPTSQGISFNITINIDVVQPVYADRSKFPGPDNPEKYVPRKETRNFEGEIKFQK